MVAVPQFTGTLFQFDFSGFNTGSLWLALITFLVRRRRNCAHHNHNAIAQWVDFLDGRGVYLVI